MIQKPTAVFATGCIWAAVVASPVFADVRLHLDLEPSQTGSATICLARFELPDTVLRDGPRAELTLTDHLAILESAGDTECRPLSESVHLVPGGWNLVVGDDENTTAHPYRVFVFPASEGIHHDQTRVRMVPSGWLDFEDLALAEDEHVVVYSPNLDIWESPPSWRALPRGHVSLQVPAGNNIRAFVFGGGRLKSVSPAIEVGPGNRTRVSLSHFSTSAVVVPVRLPAGLSNEEVELLEGLNSGPRLTVFDGAGELQKEVVLPEPPYLNQTFVVFDSMLPGEHVVELSGPAWKRVKAHIPAVDGVLSIAQEFLVASLDDRRAVYWSVPQIGASTNPLCPGTERELVPKRKLSLLSCPSGIPERGTCHELWSRSLPIDEMEGQASLPFVSGKHLFVRLEQHDATGTLSAVEDAGGTRDVAVALNPTMISGRVTRGRAPLEALVKLGSSWAATEASTGEFVSLAAPFPTWRPVEVWSCEGELLYEYIPVEPLQEGQRLNIRIPSNELVVTVYDRGTQLPLDGAQVWLYTFGGRRGDLEMHLRRLPETDELGTTRIMNLPEDRSFTVCGRKESGRESCLEEVVIDEDTKDIRLEITVPKDRLARLISAAPFRGGLAMMLRGSELLGRSPISNDGKFELDTSADRVVVVSASHPLAVVEPPRNGAIADEIQIDFPVAPARQAVIELRESSNRVNAPVGVRIGATVIPEEALRRHLSVRRLAGAERASLIRDRISAGETILVPDLLESAPIEILLWFRGADAPIPSEAPFSTREIVGLMDRRLLPPTGKIIFE